MDFSKWRDELEDLNRMPVGQRVFLAKYMEKNHPEERNIYKENLILENKEQMLERFGADGRSKSVI